MTKMIKPQNDNWMHFAKAKCESAKIGQFAPKLGSWNYTTKLLPDKVGLVPDKS